MLVLEVIGVLTMFYSVIIRPVLSVLSLLIILLVNSEFGVCAGGVEVFIEIKKGI